MDQKVIIDKTLPLFEIDYIIAWDISDKDIPCISVSLLRRSENGNSIEPEILGRSSERAGVVSLRQLLEQHQILKQVEGAETDGTMSER